MSPPPIPDALRERLGRAPTFYLENDQWYEDAYVVCDGQVHRYLISRKEQYDELQGSWTPEAFLDSDASPEARAWLRRVLAEDV